MSRDEERDSEWSACGGDAGRASRPRAAHGAATFRAVTAVGESGSCHSQESLEGRTRYINPAICVESVTVSGKEEQMTPHPHPGGGGSAPYPASERSVASASSGVSRKSCLVLDVAAVADETYRGGAPEEGRDTFRLSVASLETTSTAREERERAEQRKRRAFAEWCARKEREKRERVLRERKAAAAVAATAAGGAGGGGGPEGAAAAAAAKRDEDFERWLELKRREAERIKSQEIVRRFRNQEELDELHRLREQAKEDKLSEWARRKDEATKETKAAAARAALAAAAREERRRRAGERAYSEWLRTSQHKPLPVPLNRGELSMRGSISEMYINPEPWQPPL